MAAAVIDRLRLQAGALLLLITAFSYGAQVVWAEGMGDQEPSLALVIGESTQTVTRSDIEKRLGPATITVYSPVYQRPMTYQGFWLDELLAAYKIKLSEQDIVFQSEDGYGTSLAPNEIGHEQWLVAFGDPQGWTPLPGRHKLTLPGPWYVVGRETSSYNATPWPYQVIAIKVRADW